MTGSSEKEWYRKFQEGTFLVKGWKDQMKEILARIPSGNKEQIRNSLSKLGERIGREWARDNDVRRIDTALLQKWGEELKEAGKNGPGELMKKINEVQSSVDGILS